MLRVDLCSYKLSCCAQTSAAISYHVARRPLHRSDRPGRGVRPCSLPRLAAHAHHHHRQHHALAHGVCGLCLTCPWFEPQCGWFEPQCGVCVGDEGTAGWWLRTEPVGRRWCTSGTGDHTFLTPLLRKEVCSLTGRGGVRFGCAGRRFLG